MTEKDEKIIEETKALVNQWENGSLEVGNLGYRFQYYKFINIAYLYLHGVDAKNPDLMDEKNPHNFVADFLDTITKINEQTRIDFKELGFIVEGHSELAKYIAKAANRKALTINNDWTEVQERVTDDANWYGSGYKMIYQVKGVQKHKHLSPQRLIWNLHNFTESPKIIKINRTVQEVVDNERYKQEARTDLENIYQDDLEKKTGKRIDLFQYVDKENMYIVDILNNLVFLEGDRPKGMAFTMYSHEYRRGFSEAPGRGVFEKIMNVVVQNKVARERYNEVEAIASKLVLAKKVDGKNDKVQNKQIQNLKTGLIIPVTDLENIPQAVRIDGQAQLNELMTKIGQTKELYQTMLNVPEVLNGDAKTLGANTSGIAIQSLAENASSVHKDVKKRYARVSEYEYTNYILPYILKVFSSEDNVKKYLNPTEWNVVKKNIIDFELAVKQAELLGQGMEPGEVQKQLQDEEVKLRKEFKNDKKIISKEMLEALREDVKAIQIVVSGEKVSRQVKTEFFNGIEERYMANPQILDDPKYIGIMKRQAKNLGLDELEITEFINDIR